MAEKSFPEPRVVIFGTDKATADSLKQTFLIIENEFEVEVKLTSVADLIKLVLAAYYTLDVSYPTASVPAASMLLFLQEIVLNKPDYNVKKPSRYMSFVNSLCV